MVGGTVATELLGKTETGENIFATENIILGAAAGLLYGVGSAVLKKIGKTSVKNNEKLDRAVEKDKIKQRDAELYPERKRIPKNEEIILNILKDYMRQEGIELQGDCRTAEDFKKTITGLEKEEQRKIYNVLNQLE